MCPSFVLWSTDVEASERDETSPYAHGYLMSFPRQHLDLRGTQGACRVVTASQFLVKACEQEVRAIVDGPQTRNDRRHAGVEEHLREADGTFSIDKGTDGTLTGSEYGHSRSPEPM